MKESSANGSSSQEQNYKKEFVLRAWHLGYNLIPVKGKHPPCLKWKPYQVKAVTPEEICQWGKNQFARKDGSGTWSANPLNFALLTGRKPYSAAPALVFVDADDEAAQALVERRCPPTPVRQITGGGNRIQYGYRRPTMEEYPYLANRQGTTFQGRLYNLDIRADGGYIMAPGSIHPRTWRQYQEVEPWTLELIYQAPVYSPLWIPDDRGDNQQDPGTECYEYVPREPVDYDDDRVKLAHEYLMTRPGATAKKDPENYCFALAMDLIHGFDLTPEAAMEPFLVWGSKRSNQYADGGYYPWTEQQLWHKLTDAEHKVSSRGTGYLLPVDDRLVHDIVQPVELTPKPEAPEAPAPEAPVLATARRGYGIEEFMTFPDPTWLVENILVDDSFNVIYGLFESGKTFFALDMALSIATGREFLGNKTRQGKVAYVLAEGRGGFKKRIYAWLSHNGVNTTKDFCIIPHQFNLREPAEAQEVLRAAYKQLGTLPQVIFFDTLNKMMGGGDDGNPQDMSLYCNTKGLIVAERITCISVHHQGWTGDSPKGDGKRPRGSIILCDRADAMIEVSGDVQKVVKVRCFKSKDVAPFKPFELQKKMIPVPFDQTGQGSLVLVTKGLSLDGVSDDERAFLRSIYQQWGFGEWSWSQGQGELKTNKYNYLLKALRERGVLLKPERGGYRISPYFPTDDLITDKIGS